MKLRVAAVTALSCAIQTLAATSRCVTETQAVQLARRFAGALTQTGSDLGDTRGTLNNILASGFTETSDSILSLQHLPVSSYSSQDAQRRC